MSDTEMFVRQHLEIYGGEIFFIWLLPSDSQHNSEYYEKILTRLRNWCDEIKFWIDTFEDFFR